MTQEIVQMPGEKRIVQVGNGKEKLLLARMGKGSVVTWREFAFR